MSPPITSENHRTLTEPSSKIQYSIKKAEDDEETITVARIYKPTPDSKTHEVFQYSIKPSEFSMKLLDIIYRHSSTLGDVPLDRNIKTTVKMTPRLASVYRELLRIFHNMDKPTYETLRDYTIEIDKAYRKQQEGY